MFVFIDTLQLTSDKDKNSNYIRFKNPTPLCDQNEVLNINFEIKIV